MIDTVILTIPHTHFHITKPEQFTPHASWVHAEQQSYRGMISKQNSTKKELSFGTYKPRLTIMQWKQLAGQPVLIIEVSLPKLMFGNNFNELCYKDFSAVTNKLITVLNSMGISITTEYLAHAVVHTIHYSKNIKLTDGSTPYHYINKIQEAGIQWSLDVNKTDYRNDGHSYKWHCNSYEVVFYDKIRDLEKAFQSDKRAIEKDNAVQLHLLDSFRKRKKLEYLRMEVHLNKRAKIKQLFKKVTITTDLTFKKLFKPTIAKKVLLYYLDELESKRPILLGYKAHNDKALFADLIFNNPALGPKQIMQLFGMKKALEVMNLREIQSMFTKQNMRSWRRLIREINSTNLKNTNPFREIRKQIQIFKPI